jgi:hypothetical protein
MEWSRPGVEKHQSLIEHTGQSGAEATALQTLARLTSAFNLAKRLECGVFTAAFLVHCRADAGLI